MQRYFTHTFKNVFYKNFNSNITCHVFVSSPKYIVFPKPMCYSLLKTATCNFGIDEPCKIFKPASQLVCEKNIIRPYNTLLEMSVRAIHPVSLSLDLEDWCKKHLYWRYCKKILTCNCATHNLHPKRYFNGICFDSDNKNCHMCGIHYVVKLSKYDHSHQDGFIMFGNNFDG